ncbi:hypothetical protein ACHHYP_06907 [Achlya hypogyna]|uniref:Uncharacterized protein n=1 Tax=Achlya hypogyna TaxID=1202772 RepID=A0A1V9ZNK2_ACHHY|nr:hypothetical protein ACHHYP_06907 [Achlya hypogyna]
MKPALWSAAAVLPADIALNWHIDTTARVIRLSCRRKQLRAIPRIPDDVSGSDVVALDASLNRIQDAGRGLEQLPHLRELQLSLNQLSSGTGLERCSELRELHIARNYLTTLRWLWPNNMLVLLDVSGNDIALLDGVGACTSLATLIADENKLTSLAGLETLVQLEVLSATYNQLADDCLASMLPLVKLRSLSLSYNALSRLATVVVALPLLEEFNAVGNAVATADAYKQRLCQNPQLHVLDHTKVQPTLRATLAEVAKQHQAHDLVEATTNLYLKRLEEQKRVLDRGVQFYKTREARMTEAFEQFQREMEADMSDCTRFIHALSRQDKCVADPSGASTGRGRESYLLSNAGMQEWKQLLVAEAQAKRNADKTSPEQAPGATRPLDVSAQRPHVWRQIKALASRSLDEQADGFKHETRRALTLQEESQVELEREARFELVLGLAKHMQLADKPEYVGKLPLLRAKDAVLMERRRAASCIQRAYRCHRQRRKQPLTEGAPDKPPPAAKSTRPRFPFPWKRK